MDNTTEYVVVHGHPSALVKIKSLQQVIDNFTSFVDRCLRSGRFRSGRSSPGPSDQSLSTRKSRAFGEAAACTGRRSILDPPRTFPGSPYLRGSLLDPRPYWGLGRIPGCSWGPGGLPWIPGPKRRLPYHGRSVEGFELNPAIRNSNVAPYKLAPHRTWFPQPRRPDALCELANFALGHARRGRAG